jgi:hypothetical protein
MRKFTLLLSIMVGTHERSGVFLPVLQDSKHGLDVQVNEDQISLANEQATVLMTAADEKIMVVATNLCDAEILFSDEVSALCFAMYRLGIHLDPEDEQQVETLPTGYPVLPVPACKFADHSYPAYTKEQMLEYARDSVVRFTGFTPIEIEPTPYPFEDMYQDYAVEWCETCGGQIGDDCDCESEEDDEEEWEHEDCEHCGCRNCDCDIDEDSICSKCHSASCQCLPDFDGQEDPETKQVER